MTLPELPTTPRKTHKKTMAIGYALRDMLMQAKLDGRVTCGVFECVNLLEISPEDIMLCVLPRETNNNDVTLHIQETLIEAFCWENGIPLLMVDTVNGLQSSLYPATSDITKNRILPFTNDFSCVIIQKPDTEYSLAEQSLFYHYDKLSTTDGFLTSTGTTYPDLTRVLLARAAEHLITQ